MFFDFLHLSTIHAFNRALILVQMPTFQKFELLVVFLTHIQVMQNCIFRVNDWKHHRIPCINIVWFQEMLLAPSTWFSATCLFCCWSWQPLNANSCYRHPSRAPILPWTLSVHWLPSLTQWPISLIWWMPYSDPWTIIECLKKKNWISLLHPRHTAITTHPMCIRKLYYMLNYVLLLIARPAMTSGIVESTVTPLCLMAWWFVHLPLIL